MNFKEHMDTVKCWVEKAVKSCLIAIFEGHVSVSRHLTSLWSRNVATEDTRPMAVLTHQCLIFFPAVRPGPSSALPLTLTFLTCSVREMMAPTFQGRTE